MKYLLLLLLLLLAGCVNIPDRIEVDVRVRDAGVEVRHGLAPLPFVLPDDSDGGR